MRIGVNALYLIPGGVGGTEIYLRHLLAALARIDNANQYFIYTNEETGASLAPAGFIHRPQPVRAANRPARILHEQFRLGPALRSDNVDVLLNPGFTAPVLAPCPQATVFHDLQHLRHPEYFRWFDLPFWRLLLGLSARRSQCLIADSESTRDDLIHFYRLPREKVAVAPLGVEADFLDLQWMPDRERPFLLCVSTLHPHKNHDRLLRAFARFRQRHCAVPWTLVLAGLRGFETSRIEALIRELALEKHTRITGWIPRPELLDLYRRASAFLYPSTFEGFGLPVLEAMAAGLPLACSNIRPLKALAAGAATLFEPYQEDALLAAMETITAGREPLSAQIAEARRRAAGYTWEATARATLACLETAAQPS